MPFIPPSFDGSTPMIPQLQGSGGIAAAPAAFESSTPDAMISQLIEQYMSGGGDGGMAELLDNLDPAMRSELEKAIKDRFQQLNQSGLQLEARPGSKAAEALANGDLSGLSGEDLMQLLVSLAQYAQNRRNPQQVAQQPSAPLAPTGSWGSSGNSAGGGTSYTGANANAATPRGPAPAAGPIPPGSPGGVHLAETARDVAAAQNSTGWCFKYAAQSIAEATGVQLHGASAYMAADQLAASDKFKEITVSPDQLKDLPPGAVVVWGQTDVSPHGHISVALGNGQEASDHIQDQMTSLRGHQNYRVFILNEQQQ